MSNNFYHEDFIGFYENKFPDGLCDKLIDLFTQIESEHAVDIFRLNSLLRNDFSINLQNFAPGHNISIFSNKLIFDGLRHYADNYPILKNFTGYNPSLKVQKTISGGGFHNWHCEKPYFVNHFDKDRLLAWMVYLNDDYEGGETEFTFLSKRIKPKKGTLLMWPSGFTHTHRGGMVVSGEKYILTGWIYYAGVDESQAPIYHNGDVES